VPVEYSVETCRALGEIFHQAQVLRPMRVDRYEPGTRLRYEMTGVAPARRAAVELRVERFVGGGFAGQVYRVEVLSVEGGPIAGLRVGGPYAVKILVPAQRGKRRFRDALFALGFQGPFSPQVNPAAARAGAIWQKLIRRGAGIRFGTERAVVDVLATFYDASLGSCGEISEWVEGRTWRFEADDRLDARRRWRRGLSVAPESLGSPEYRAKRRFMAELVGLLHAMGAPELARQYEWWTAKSQPNALKRLDCEGDPAAGLTAVDFRAGLALLPVLPMSPADFRLILDGVIRRGAFVQFDRGDLDRLQRFVDRHAERFADLREALAELRQLERAYRDSLPDLTHHGLRLATDRRLHGSVLAGAIQGAEANGRADSEFARRLRRRRATAAWFVLIGLVPLLGRFVQRLWGRSDYRRHVGRQLTSWSYFVRAWRARVAETLTRWHRAGAVAPARAMKLVGSPLRFIAHAVFFGFMPGRLHRFLTDRRYAFSAVRRVVTRPIRLYFNAQAREQWLRDMVAEGRRDGMLTDQEAGHITARVKEPFIQKYLQALAVHVCTLPVTQIVSLLVAVVYVLKHPELSWPEATVHAGVILGLFQVTPISPGSITRGLYVVYLVVRERNFRDYNIAVFLAFFKYVGYLAFPVQMAYRYPALARFMAGRWATGAVHVVPVFGERGALLEHGVFDAFYNRLLTLRRRFREADLMRRALPTRRWHLPICAFGATAALVAVDLLWARRGGQVPSLPRIWYVALWPGLLAGVASAVLAGGAAVSRRMLMAVGVGIAIGAAYGLVHAFLAAFVGPSEAAPAGLLAVAWAFVAAVLWRVFFLTFAAGLGAFVAETKLAGPIETGPAGG